MKARAAGALALLALGAGGLHAETPGEERIVPVKVNNGPGGRMDYGTVVSYFAHNPADKKEIIYKGISIKLGDAGICFDAETLRYAAGWSGGFLDMTKSTPAVTGQGSGVALITGKPLFATRTGPGWANKGDFKDARPGEYGNLPGDWAHFHGFYRNGDQVVLSYSIGDCDVREMPGAVAASGATVFTRAFQLSKTGSA